MLVNPKPWNTGHTGKTTNIDKNTQECLDIKGKNKFRENKLQCFIMAFRW